MTTQETIDQFEKYVIANYGRLPKVIVKGQGCYLFDADGKLIKTSVPYYSRDGRLLESREYNSAGKLEEVIVFIGERIVGLTPEGKKIDKYDDATVDVQGFLDHFRNK